MGNTEEEEEASPVLCSTVSLIWTSACKAMPALSDFCFASAVFVVCFVLFLCLLFRFLLLL